MCLVSHLQQFRCTRPTAHSSTPTSLEHTLQFLHSLLNLRLQLGEDVKNFSRRAMRYFFMNNYFVAVEREVVALSDNVRLGYTKTLRGTRILSLSSIALRPACEDVGQVVLRVFVGSERGLGHRAKFFPWQ